jgi:hypothetical protein
VRWLGSLLVTTLGWAIALGLQWSWQGEPGAPPTVPAWAHPLLPLLLFLAFGLYIGLATGGTPPRGRMLLQAAIALGVAALPFAYAYGLAARYGLPAHGGPLGTAAAQPLPRGLAAAWFGAALAAALRPRPTAGQATPSTTRLRHAESPAPGYWSPAPVTEPGAALTPTLAPPVGGTDTDQG